MISIFLASALAFAQTPAGTPSLLTCETGTECAAAALANGVTCSSGADCAAVAVSEGIYYGISKLVSPRKPAINGAPVFTLHCTVAGENAIERWPCDTIEVTSKTKPQRSYRGERIAFLLVDKTATDDLVIRRAKCPKTEKPLHIFAGGSAAIEFKEKDCAI